MELYVKILPTTETGFTLSVYHQNNGATREYTIKILGSYGFRKIGLTYKDILLTQKYFDRKCRELYKDNKDIRECYEQIMDLCKEYSHYNFDT